MKEKLLYLKYYTYTLFTALVVIGGAVWDDTHSVEKTTSACVVTFLFSAVLYALTATQIKTK